MGKISLRRAQFEKALGGNVAMQIWLGKQHLDQRDKIEQTSYNEPLPLIIERAMPLKDKPKRKGNLYEKDHLKNTTGKGST